MLLLPRPLLIILLLVALPAAASGQERCRFTSLPAHSGELAARAECHWNAPIERVSAVLKDLEGHAHVMSGLAESRILEHDGAGVRSLQIHRQTGMSDRAVVVDWRFETLPDADGDGRSDGERLEWTRSDDQSAARGLGTVPELCRGSWELSPTERGTRVVYTLHYAPGGSIPWFVLRRFNQVAVRSVTDELRHAVAAPDVAAR